MNMDAFLASIRIIVLFLTLPYTKNEWPWVDPEESRKNSPIKKGENQEGAIK